jgi:hypothetical protein
MSVGGTDFLRFIPGRHLVPLFRRIGLVTHWSGLALRCSWSLLAVQRLDRVLPRSRDAAQRRLGRGC